MSVKIPKLICYESGKFISLSKAATTFDIPGSTLGHRLNGRQSWQKAHEIDQVLSPTAEKAIIKWILELGLHRFPPRLDRVWQMAEELAVEERKALREWYEKEGRQDIVHDRLGRIGSSQLT
ncbi:hypothetical protein HOY80DRAFT_1136458 [Tuber brumale]|nr:hypothetical protein HOY80DRAFT_1136458 [Tuber brumale]